jgi:hypothetical protein
MVQSILNKDNVSINNKSDKQENYFWFTQTEQKKVALNLWVLKIRRSSKIHKRRNS